VYVTPVGEDLGSSAPDSPDHRGRQTAFNIRVTLRGMVNSMDQSFKSFGIGFGLSFILLFLILVAQFRSWIDPFLIMLAIPMGFIGVLIILPLTHTTLNVMSLMGVLMLIGIADSNSILIVDFAHKLEEQGCRCRRRDHGLPRAPAADSDDLAGDHHRDDPHGDEARRGRRTVHAHGARHHRRPDFVGAAHRLHRAGRLSSGLWKEGTKCRRINAKSRLNLGSICARFPQTLAQRNPRPAHADAAAGRGDGAARIIRRFRPRRTRSTIANQQIVENRSAYYPHVTGDLTGSQANDLARIGAGDIRVASFRSRGPRRGVRS
jgi:hypothetical protein